MPRARLDRVRNFYHGLTLHGVVNRPIKGCGQPYIGRAHMDENRVSETVRNVGGKAEEGLGRATGDLKTQVQGKLDQAARALPCFATRKGVKQ